MSKFIFFIVVNIHTLLILKFQLLQFLKESYTSYLHLTCKGKDTRTAGCLKQGENKKHFLHYKSVLLYKKLKIIYLIHKYYSNQLKKPENIMLLEY